MSYSHTRYHFLDVIRGLTLLSMIAYHTAWDLVYMYGVDWPFYRSEGAHIWQQSICCTFIFLSGFCFILGKHPLKRGLIISLGGLLVTAVTLTFMPENRVIFGVLTLIGASMLLTILIDKMTKNSSPLIGLMLCFILFLFTRSINGGYLGFGDVRVLTLPSQLYQGYFMTFLGFPAADFYSTDYFSLIPWFFLYLTGYFAGRMFRNEGWLSWGIFSFNVKPISYIGRHSLLIYLIHQPVIYGVCEVLRIAGIL